MSKKYIIVIVGVILFLTLTNLLKVDPIKNEVAKEKEEVVKDSAKEDSQEVNLIDYFNLEGENRALQAQIDRKNHEIFELYKIIVSSGTLETLPENENIEFVLKEVLDTEIILLTSENSEYYNRYNLSVMTAEDLYWNSISSLDYNEMINWTSSSGLYSGIMRGSEIDKVLVYKNEQAYETKIIDIHEGLRLWFAIQDYEAKSMNDELDQITIQALDSNGNVLWEESFENEFDRRA